MIIYGTNEIAFPDLGIRFAVDPDAFTAFGFAVKWYAIIIAIGVICAYLYGLPRMRKNGLDDDKAFDCVFWGFISAIIGARLYYVLMTIGKINWTFFSIIDIRQGGLAIYGGIIGAVIGGYIASRVRKIRFVPVLDVAAPAFFIGQCIGRWGNFVNQEAFGTNTDLPWGMTGGRIQAFIRNNGERVFEETGIRLDQALPVHPCFLYESLWCLLGFLVIHFIVRKIRTFDGEVILFYAAWYGFGRAAIETFRTDSLMIGDIRVSQALGLITAAAATVLIFVIKARRAKLDLPLYKFTEEAKANVLEAEERDRLYKEAKAAKREEKTREFADELRSDEKLIADDEDEASPAITETPQVSEANSSPETPETPEANSSPDASKTPESED
jgi:phosphatidylglycerol:prolipoprotein diacylglycerol transferase